MRLTGLVQKKWGHELIFATNELYCGKILHFHTGSRFSMHFHAQKDETWYVLSGQFVVKCIDTHSASDYEKPLRPGDVWHNPPLSPHQLICVESGDIIEVSTADSVEDNHRVRPGDSQC